MITIIDYGAGNLGSIMNMIRKIGSEARISSDKEEIASAEKLLLPGVGSFDYGITKLMESNLIETINQRVLVDKVPILGICLGVQLFTKGSEEGALKGLGWFDAQTVKFELEEGSSLKVPHMGWNEVQCVNNSKLFTDLQQEPRFYFVHSYHLKCANEQDVMVNAKHGYEFVAGMENGNKVGVQFHPEKSHKFGMKILENYIKYY